MRETVLEKPGAEKLTIQTDDRGTLLLAEDGFVREEYGADLHETLIARLGEQGWRVTGNRDLAPPGAPRPRPPSAPGAGQDPTATVKDGEDA